MGMTVTEKILAKHANLEKVIPGEIVKAEIDFAFMPALTAVLAFNAMNDMEIQKVWDNEKVTILLDHIAPATNITNATLHKKCRDIAKEQNLKYFYDVNNGVCHQVIPERGHVYPGMVLVGADSHTCTHGAFGAFATGIGSTDMGAVLGTGKLWFKVPETILIQVEGLLPKHVYSKDVILKAAKELGADGGTYCALEFSGSTIQKMSIGARMTLCNMAIELGGKSGIIEPDSKTKNYLKDIVKYFYMDIHSSTDANYKQTLEIRADELMPQVACPHSVDNVKPINEVEDIKVNQVFIGSCTNGRLEDLKIASQIIKGNKVHPDVRLIVTPASTMIWKQANREGILNIFVESGGIVMNASCSACFGGNNGIIAPGEVSLSTSNRNFKGRQGSTEGYVYLASPATAAVSAIKGVITDPRKF